MAFGRRKREPAEQPPGSPTDPSGEPLENAALVEAMRNVSVHDTRETRALLFQLMLDSTLVVATPDPPPTPTARVAKAGETMALITLESDDGPVLPVFTSTRTLVEWAQRPIGYAAMPARAIFEMALSAGTAVIAIDPGSPTRGTVTRDEIEALGRGRLPLGSTAVVPETTNVLVGRPADPPPQPVLDQVAAVLAADGRAEAAWLYLMQQGPMAPELVVGVRLTDAIQVDEPAKRAAMHELAQAVGASCEAARGFLFITADAEFAAKLAAGTGIELFHR